MLHNKFLLVILSFWVVFPVYGGEEKEASEKPGKEHEQTAKKIPAKLQELIDRIKKLDENEAFDELDRAVRTGNKNRVKVVLYLNPKFLNKQDKFKRTPLYNAVFANQKEIVEYLVTKRADMKIPDVNGDTPLHAACAEGLKDIAEYLVKKGAMIFAVNNKGETALFKAASNGEVDVAVFLLSKGVRVNGTDKKGNTPLHRAAYKGQVKMVDFLLKMGADKDKKNKRGQTPADVANKAVIKKKLGKK